MRKTQHQREVDQVVSDNLYLSISNILGVRVTPSNLRRMMNDLSGTGGITSKVKTDIIIEILVAFAELEKKNVK